MQQYWKLIVLLIVFLFGVAVIAQIIRKKNRKIFLGEAMFLGMGMALVLLAVISMCLSWIGFFRLRYIWSIYILILCAIGAYCKIFEKVSTNKRRIIEVWQEVKVDKGLIFILIIASVLYLLFPSYYMWSGRDYGVYIVNAVHTSETGSSVYQSDEFINEHYEELKDFLELGYPAFYSSYEDGISSMPGDINAQFLPLFWCLLAIGYSILGMRALVRVPAVITLVALGVYYYLVKRNIDKRIAFLSTLLLAICPAQIWGARITQSEQMAQLIFFLFISCFLYGWSEYRDSWVYFAGILAGIGNFCRLDNYVLGIGIFIFGIYIILWNRKRCKTVMVLILEYLSFGIASFIYGVIVHYHYFYEHWGKGVLKYLTIGNIFLALIFFMVFLTRKKKKEDANRVYIFFKNRNNVKILYVAFALTLLNLFISNPFVSDSDITVPFLQQYGWYICPILFLFFVIGLFEFSVIEEENEYERKEASMLFVGIGIISLLLYTFFPSITLDHFWMSRRWIVVNFPFVIAFGVYGIIILQSLCKKRSRMLKGIQIVCVSAILIYIIAKDCVIWNKAAFKEMPSEFARVADELPNDKLILTQNEGYAAMLRYVYHKQVYLLKDDFDKGALRDYCKNNDGEVYFLGENPREELFWGIAESLCVKDSISVTEPETVFNKYPEEWFVDTRNADLYQMKVVGENVLDITARLKLYDNSFCDKSAIYTQGRGVAFYGPYVKIENGEYECIINITTDDESQEVNGLLEVVNNEEVIKSLDVRQAGQKKVAFLLNDNENVLQVRYTNYTDSRLKIDDVQIIR